MRRASEAVDEVVGRPGARELQEAFAHHGAGGGELVLVALDTLAVDEMGDVENHLSTLGKTAADFFIERHE
jgi:hypothetical protein